MARISDSDPAAETTEVRELPKRGRPRDTDLTERLMDAALDTLAENGWSRLTADTLGIRARAGKAGIYRRWPSMSLLAGDALAHRTLVTSPPPGRSLRADLVSLLEPWTRPMNRDELAAAALVGEARHDAVLRAALDAAVVQPLAAVVADLGQRSGERGHVCTARGIALLGVLVQALWWDRYLGSPAPMAGGELDAFVDSVLMPVVTPMP